MLNLQREIYSNNNSHRAQSFSGTISSSPQKQFSCNTSLPQNLLISSSDYHSRISNNHNNSNNDSNNLESSTTITAFPTFTATISSTNTSHQNLYPNNHSLSIVAGGTEISSATIQQRNLVDLHSTLGPEMQNSSEDFVPEGKRRARCLKDYQTSDSSGLTLKANEIIVVYHSSELDSEWLIGERGTEKGKVPFANLEILN